ncbi:transmembrane protein [Klebsiella quasipneumoniae]|nr:transmembrane protein [Klebsiella quasipneumoniae]
MLSVIPAGLFSRLRIFLGRLKPHALPVARRHIVLGSIGAGTGLAVTSMFSHWLLGEVNLWFIAPMGASAVLLFGVRAVRWRSRGRLSAAMCCRR